MTEQENETTQPKKEVSGSWVLLMFMALFAIVIAYALSTQ